MASAPSGHSIKFPNCGNAPVSSHIMKLSFIFSVFIFVVVVSVHGQISDSLNSKDNLFNYFSYNKKEYTLTKEKPWQDNSKSIFFENQGMFHSAYFLINKDSSFVFLCVYECGFFLTTGKWANSNDSILNFTWNREKSIALCKDKQKYKKYYSYGFPVPLPINNWVFTKRNDVLFPKIN
jgi:hypothetical protein